MRDKPSYMWTSNHFLLIVTFIQLQVSVNFKFHSTSSSATTPVSPRNDSVLPSTNVFSQHKTKNFPLLFFKINNFAQAHMIILFEKLHFNFVYIFKFLFCLLKCKLIFHYFLINNEKSFFVIIFNYIIYFQFNIFNI